ncbi:NAD-dependent epimerase/dehydratase family protein [Roseomonas sp. SSH11]|uniref:NAD-dependent epimerase/dehydratase family protein n=2 Tax=Pararoseomonas baculiformis TaxID=2820812 RepID=A0ABS4ABX5_9PROT|nr:NAD-dependent epimerase/dehydratase family protein [Pararoseomonas baculiformis]MBP0444522.1 NAD-dependent epimerase/dehydratase family protein [Pararoseomonas baculiformis]
MGRILVTGAAGFIGAHLCQALLARGDEVIGIDNFNPYYDPALKEARVMALTGNARPGAFRMHRIDLADTEALLALMAAHPEIDRVAHLGAQAGVRWSLQAPFAYTAANVTGHLGILEGVRRSEGRIGHTVYASTSSVYGSRTDGGSFQETDRVDHPASLYAATKRAGELMSSVYTDLYHLPLTGLRFFTVYGPWGRPDMAYWLFTEAMLKGRPIELFNEGRMRRDFTFVSDIVAGVIAALDQPPADGGHRLYNIGNSNPEELLDMVGLLEELLGVQAHRVLKPMQPGDVPATFADVSAMKRDFGWEPTTDLRTGLSHFVAWWRNHFG